MARLYTPLEDVLVVVMDEVVARPSRLVAARQGDLPPVEGVEPPVVRGSVRHTRGDHDAVAVVERDEAAVEGAVVKRVEQETVRRHEALNYVITVSYSTDTDWIAMSERPEQGKPMYLVISDDIKSKIENGELKIGDTLPSVRDLATQYNSSNSTPKMYLKMQ